MPNNAIVQVHRLAVAAKEYEGIIFIDTHNNILTDQMKRASHMNMNSKVSKSQE